MSFEFPYGKAPFWIMILALFSGLGVYLFNLPKPEQRADLVFATFAKAHYLAYVKQKEAFEKEHNVKVKIQLVDQRALESRLQSAFLADTDVPDMVEILNDTMGYFLSGPLDEIGFVDLTDRLHEEGLMDRMVRSRFSQWNSRGRIFALPHDVHPVMLAYRQDMVDKLGIDVSKIKTWDDFFKEGQRITKDYSGDGVIDHYMMDLPSNGGWGLETLILQRGAGYFNEQGELTTNSQVIVDTILWYIKASRGDGRISFPADWGQTLSQALMDGLVVFMITPDWRAKLLEQDVPSLKGLFRVMPLPVWEEGGSRTSTWGGTGLTITKKCKQQELAWKFAKFLYLKKEHLKQAFSKTSILPPLKESWAYEELNQGNDFFGGQKTGKMYSSIADETPGRYVTPYIAIAQAKMDEVFMDSCLYFEEKGEEGLRAYVEKELEKKSNLVQRMIDRNKFLSSEQKPNQKSPAELGRN